MVFVYVFEMVLWTHSLCPTWKLWFEIAMLCEFSSAMWFQRNYLCKWATFLLMCVHCVFGFAAIDVDAFYALHDVVLISLKALFGKKPFIFCLGIDVFDGYHGNLYQYDLFHLNSFIWHFMTQHCIRHTERKYETFE